MAVTHTQNQIQLLEVNEIARFVCIWVRWGRESAHPQLLYGYAGVLYIRLLCVCVEVGN